MVATVTLRIIGNRDFFDRTKTLRDDLKDNGHVVVEESVEPEVRDPGLITVERAEPNPNHVITGLIKVVNAPPDFVNRIPPSQAAKEGLAVGLELSLKRHDLEAVIKRELFNLAGDYLSLN